MAIPSPPSPRVSSGADSEKFPSVLTLERIHGGLIGAAGKVPLRTAERSRRLHAICTPRAVGAVGNPWPEESFDTAVDRNARAAKRAPQESDA
jgi:hypothetical protein